MIYAGRSIKRCILATVFIPIRRDSKLPVKCIRVRLSTSQLPMKLELIDRPLELLSLVDAEY